MATNPDFGLITAAEFLEMDFGPDRKMELDRGVIRMMTGGTGAHAGIQANILSALRNALRGSGCRPFGSDMAIETGPGSVRYPDISILCGNPRSPDNDTRKSFTDPRVIIEILSPTTMDKDQTVKLAEYQSLASVEMIVFVEPTLERIRVLQRLSPQSWRDDKHAEPVDLVLPSLGIMLPHDEIFARD